VTRKPDRRTETRDRATPTKVMGTKTAVPEKPLTKEARIRKTPAVPVTRGRIKRAPDKTTSPITQTKTVPKTTDRIRKTAVRRRMDQAPTTPRTKVRTAQEEATVRQRKARGKMVGNRKVRRATTKRMRAGISRTMDPERGKMKEKVQIRTATRVARITRKATRGPGEPTPERRRRKPTVRTMRTREVPTIKGTKEIAKCQMKAVLTKAVRNRIPNKGRQVKPRTGTNGDLNFGGSATERFVEPLCFGKKAQNGSCIILGKLS
jgi:hypothetical protein